MAMLHDDLNLGLGYHQNGNLVQAAQLYQNVLARDPQQVDALHLLGVVAIQQGDPARAVGADRPGDRAEPQHVRLPLQPGRSLSGVGPA